MAIPLFILCNAQDVLHTDSYSPHSISNNSYGPYSINGTLPFLLSSDQNSTRGIQYGWSTHQWDKHYDCPTYHQQLALTEMCSAWSQERFARTIQETIAYFLSCGYSRDQAEEAIVAQYHLYLLPNFIKNIKNFSGYRCGIKKLIRTQQEIQSSFWSKVLAFVTPVDQRKKAFWKTITALHQELLEEEKVQDEYEAKIHSAQQEAQYKNIRTTFDANRDELALAIDEWRELIDSYDQKGVSGITRIERRMQSVHCMTHGQSMYSQQSYTVSSSAAKLRKESGSDAHQYEILYGNQLQQVIHQECIDGIEHLAVMRPSAMMYPYRHGIAECFDAAREYNQAGVTSKAAAIADFCWTLLDCGLAVAEGAVDGVIGAVKDIVHHPIEAAICAVAGEYVLAYQVSKVVYTVADIGITALSDTDRAAQKWNDYIAPVTHVIDAIEKKKIGLRDGFKAAAQCAAHWKTQDKLLNGLGKICTTVKSKAIEFAQRNPLATPQQYMATPDGILLQSMQTPPAAGGCLQYEGRSKLFIAHHQEADFWTGFFQYS